MVNEVLSKNQFWTVNVVADFIDCSELRVLLYAGFYLEGPIFQRTCVEYKIFSHSERWGVM
jgi:hypothetical protein